MDLVDGAGRICANHDLYRGDVVFHHGCVLIPWVSGTSVWRQSWNLPFDPASIAVGRWLLHGVAILILAAEIDGNDPFYVTTESG